MKNEEVADLLFNIADLLDVLGVAFKPQAYKKAARSIENLGEDIELYYKNNKLDSIPGVGKSIAEKISEFLEKGKSSYYEDLKKKIPAGVADIVEIPGVGPRKAMFLYKTLGIKSVNELKKAAERHRLARLKGFGEKSEASILRSINIAMKQKGRFLLGVGLPIAEEIINQLKLLKGVEKINLAGSTRRMKETVGDLDILVVSKNPKPIMDYFTSMEDVVRILAKGDTKSSIVLSNNLQVDLRVVENGSFGSALQYFTGSKDHNIKLRELCKRRGWKLNEYGLFDNNKRKIAGRTEKEIYEKLGMQFIPPEMRENTGEVESALNHNLPKILDYNSIRGDLHIHSNYSDGTDTIKELAVEAKKMGYEYIAITDHSKSERIANGLSREDVIKRNKEIDKLNESLPIKILKGMEVDILSDGSLDYDNSLLKKLDVVIIAIHSGFKSTKEEMTKRILKAMENPYVHILAHPTGRLIGKREPYDVDIDKIIKSAKEHNIALEVNSQPSRLDLNAFYVKQAVFSKAKIVINTDAHAKSNLKFMKLGIGTARRGWAKEQDVINTMSYSKLKKWLNR